MIYIGNRYKIIEEIGRGCKSCLYKGKDYYDGQTIIINIIDSGVVKSKKFISNLIDEATTINEIDSPNILKIKDVGMYALEDGSEVYYTINDYIEGSTLEQLTKYHRLNIEEIVIILRQLLNALEVAHSYNIYHGCLHPSNILVDEGYNVKLSNIGIIKANNKIFNNGIKHFTENLNYMCPHQICLGYTDKSSDFYALGIIIFELIFDKHPFGEIDDEEEILRRMDKGIKWKDFDTEFVPEKILNILEKLLSRTNRYETPKEVIIDLSHYMYEVENLLDERQNIEVEIECIQDDTTKKVDKLKKGHKLKKVAAVGLATIVSFLVLGIYI